MPLGWQKVMGSDHWYPPYHEWLQEQVIKKQLLDGKITQEEAKRKTKELMEQLRLKYNPTREESDAERRRQELVDAAEEAARQPNVFDMPSLFDD